VSDCPSAPARAFARHASSVLHARGLAIYDLPRDSETAGGILALATSNHAGPQSMGDEGDWEVSVWYSATTTPDCTSDAPDATTTFTTAACNCLVEFDGCIASATFAVSSTDDTITANLYAGGGCDGDSLTGDTQIDCGDCYKQGLSLLPGVTSGVAIQIDCPSDWPLLVVIVIIVVGACVAVLIHNRCRAQLQNNNASGGPHAQQQVMLSAPLLSQPPGNVPGGVVWSYVPQQGIPAQMPPDSQPIATPQPSAISESLSTSEGLPGGPVEYTVVHPSVIRSEISPSSSKVGEASPGEVILVSESGISSTGVARVKCDRGWLSVRATDGTVLLQKQSGTQTKPQKDPFSEFCLLHKLSAFESALVEMGVAEPLELVDVTDEELISIGLNSIQLKRLRKKLQAMSEQEGEPDTQATSLNAAIAPSVQSPDRVPDVDESVDVLRDGGAIGGSE
jgi:hypothetical protein